MDDKTTKKGIDETGKKTLEEEEIKAEAKETIYSSGQTTMLKMAGIALFALVFGVGLGYVLFGLSTPTGAVVEYGDTTTTVDITPTTIPSVEGVKDGDMVKVNYVGYFENGTIFDTSIESMAKEAGLYDSRRPYEPLMVMLGGGMVISGFNDGLIGMSVGEDKTIEIPQEEGYPMGPLANKTLYFNVTLVEIVEPVDIKLTVLNDKRCDKCDVTSVISQLKMMFLKLDVGEIDYATDDGRKLYQDLGLKYLPALLFDKSIESSENYGNVEGYLEEVGDYYSLRIGAGFDPTAEICDNEIDDTGNGKIDCEDESCGTHPACMETLCDDGIDDEGDGLVDCDDPDCASKLTCNKDAVIECVEPYNLTADTIIFYYSNQCGWCAKMKPLVQKLQDEDYSFYWADAGDAESTEVIEKCVREYITSGGVPQFICAKNAKIHVGAFMEEKDLKKFADDCIAG